MSLESRARSLSAPLLSAMSPPREKVRAKQNVGPRPCVPPPSSCLAESCPGPGECQPGDLLVQSDAQGGEDGPRVTMDATSETMNSTRKMKKTSLAISAAATEIPVNPTKPAISAIMKKTAAQ